MGSRYRDAGGRDVEKRWRDPATAGRVVGYDVLVVALAAVALAVFAISGSQSVLIGAAVPAVLLAGGLVALGCGMVAYRHGGNWVHWQAGAWFLLLLSLVALSVPAAVALL